MKTCSLYGFLWALTGAVLGLLLYFAGFEADATKLAAGQGIRLIAGLIIAVVFLVLAIRARRAETPLDREFGYGSALGAGVLTSLVASALSSVFAFCYFSFINPGVLDLMVQAQVDKIEASGATGDKLDKAEGMIRWIMHPVPLTIYVFGFGFIIAVILSLIVAAFIKRPAPAGIRQV